MQIIAHVFPSRGELRRHMNDVFCEDIALSADKRRDSYLDYDGRRHFCWVVKDREDVKVFLAWVFSGHVIHGPFYELDPDAYDYMEKMLQARTRKEVA